MVATLCARCRTLVAASSARRPLLPAQYVLKRQKLFSTGNTGPEDSSSSSNIDTDGDAEKSSGSVIFSGIQPTGVPHLGNYLGALRQWKRLQDESNDGDVEGNRKTKLFFSIVDLHAITMPQDPETLRTWRKETLAALLAIGLDPARSTIFYQSSVPQHAELMWILSCTASMGYLSRMTQYKSKLLMSNNRATFNESTAERLKLGLFSYPVLQAADILVHRATHVPVGDDQRQHLEFARECATNFNRTYRYESLLVSPETITTTSPRIMSLANPLRKMSKSSPKDRSRILITASPEEIRQRIRVAITDMEPTVSYDPIGRPGVANLLEILLQCDPDVPRDMTVEELAKNWEGMHLRELKEAVIGAVTKELEGVRERYLYLLRRYGGRYLDDVEADGAERARASAEETMRFVRAAVGLSKFYLP